VANLPGVTGARLNPTVGKLVVEGVMDLDAIRSEGRKENYRIQTAEERKAAPQTEKGIDWELLRTIASGVGVAVGYAAENLGAPSVIFMPLFIVAIVLGGWGNFRKAAFSLPKLDFNMSVLMSVAILGAGAIGAWEEAAVVAFLFSDLRDARVVDDGASQAFDRRPDGWGPQNRACRDARRRHQQRWRSRRSSLAP